VKTLGSEILHVRTKVTAHSEIDELVI